MNLQLSDAIAMGRMLVPDPTPGDIHKCAIGMALLAHNANYTWPRAANKFLGYEELEAMYPWLRKEWKCPWCMAKIHNVAILYHVFDTHVMAKVEGHRKIIRFKSITLDQMIDWVRSIEPAPPAREETATELVEEAEEVVAV